MAEIVLEIFGRVVVELVAAGISGAIRSSTAERRQGKPKNQLRSTQGSIPSSLKKKPLTSQTSPAQFSRAVLIVSSNISFGNDCERLVNIAFQTSQTFSKIMDTYADVIQYIRKELAKHYPDEYFHIIIGENEKFAFAVDDTQHYAEIKHERYNVLIFSTKVNSQTKSDSHDANSQMLLVWK